MEDRTDPVTPPPPTESAGWGWGGFISSLSTQASSLVDAYVSDIKEFGSTIKHDTTAALESVAHQIESPASASSTEAVSAPIASIKSGLSSFVHGVSDFAQGVAKELGETHPRATTPQGSELTTFTPSQLSETLNSADEQQFKEWMASFNLEDKKSVVSHLLANNAAILALYQSLVPNELSADEFWGRYFFKLDQEAKREEKRAALLSKTKLMASKLQESEFSWDDDEVAASDVLPPATETHKEPAPISGPVSSESQASNAENTSDLEGKSVEEEADTKEGQLEAVEKTTEVPAAADPTPTTEAPSLSADASKTPKNDDEDVFDWN